MGILSLFSGCGGCSLGLRQAGLRVNLAIDIDKDACNTYEANLGQNTTWCNDLSKITPHELLERSGLRRENVDLLVGGPPCQGFSSAGAKDWTDPRTILIRNFVEIVVTLRPTWFIMENVEGLLTANNGIFLIGAIMQFLEAGYWLRAKKIYMERYGLPQRRKRVFIIGNLERCEFNFPEPTHFEQQTLFNSEQPPFLNILDAIGDLPPATNIGEVFYDKEPENYYQNRLRRTDDRPILHHQIKGLNGPVQQRIALL